jgi:transmembrane sensor
MSNAERIDAIAAGWLARQDGDDWDADDQQRLGAWLQEATAHRLAWLRLHSAWQRAEGLAQLAGSDRAVPTAADVQASSIPPQALSAEYSQRRWLGAFAAMAVILVASWFGLRPGTSIETYATAVGGRETIRLADGSRLTLNTQTRARATISTSERRVWLDEGEAYFEVQRDPARPFVVSTGSEHLTVVGTKFALRHDANTTQVTVIDGKVLLERMSNPAGSSSTSGRNSHSAKVMGEPLLLGANDSVVIQGDSVLVRSKTADEVTHDLSWRDGRLYFDQRTLGEIAAEFNRYNHKQLVVDATVANVRLGGSFEAANLNSFVGLVRDGFGIKVAESETQIRLSK